MLFKGNLFIGLIQPDPLGHAENWVWVQDSPTWNIWPAKDRYSYDYYELYGNYHICCPD